jgi:hypothetical protein
VAVSDAAIRSARLDWEEGERRLRRAREDPIRGPVIDDVVDHIRRELARRLGQTYTLGELVALYRSSGTWCRDIAQRTAPDAAYAHELAVVADPVFAGAARGASDWVP